MKTEIKKKKKREEQKSEALLKISLLLGVRGLSEGLQVLLLGILFQRLHLINPKFWTKNQVLLFLLVCTKEF